MDTEELDNLDDEPQDDDYIVSSCGPLGSWTRVSRVHSLEGAREFKSNDRESADYQAYKYIRDNMEEEQYWPNTWYMSDHGNLSKADEL